LYGRSDLSEEAARIRKAARERSFDGKWFRDHAVRDGTGELKVSDDMSETCQYYAFKFGLAHPGSDTNLWDRVVRRLGRCGPWQHRALGRMYPSNYFQGLMLRHMLLTDNKLHREAVRELGYLVDMADRTGTLWESYPGIGDGFCWLPGYSRCQGFTSYAAVLIVRNALGISSIDRRNRRVRFAVPDNGLRFCRGTLPTVDGPIEVAWERLGGRIVREKVRLPPGWVRVNDADGPAADRSVARE
jgi:alpha-L-rhamnosidase